MPLTAAFKKYLAQGDDLQAGQTPRVALIYRLEKLSLKHKKALYSCGELRALASVLRNRNSHSIENSCTILRVAALCSGFALQTSLPRPRASSFANSTLGQEQASMSRSESRCRESVERLVSISAFAAKTLGTQDEVVLRSRCGGSVPIVRPVGLTTQLMALVLLNPLSAAFIAFTTW